MLVHKHPKLWPSKRRSRLVWVGRHATWCDSVREASGRILSPLISDRHDSSDLHKCCVLCELPARLLNPTADVTLEIRVGDFQNRSVRISR